MKKYLTWWLLVWLISGAEVSQAQPMRLVMPVGHHEQVTAADFSPDGRLVVTTAANEATAMVWNAETGEPLLRLAHTGKVRWASFSPDSKWLVTIDEPLEAPREDGPYAYYLSMREKRVAQGIMRVWNLTTGLVVKEFPWQGPYAFFSPDSQQLLISGDSAVYLHRLDNSAPVREWQQDSAFADFNPDGRLFTILTSNRGPLTVRRADTGAELPLLVESTTPGQSAQPYRGVVRWARFTPDSRQLLTIDDAAHLRWWDATSGKLTQLITLEGLEDPRTASFGFSPDRQRIRVVRNMPGKALEAPPSYRVEQWNTATGARLPSLTHAYEINSVAFSADGQRAVTCADRNRISVWDAATGTQLCRIEHSTFALNWRERYAADTTARWPNFAYDYAGADFSPDGSRLVTTGGDRAARIWNARTGELLVELLGHARNVRTRLVSPDHQTLALLTTDSALRLFDLTTGTLPGWRPARTGKWGKLVAAAFSPDGQRLVTADLAGTVAVWDPRQGVLLRTIASGSSAKRLIIPAFDKVVGFSPDHERVFAVLADDTLRAWEVATGQPLFSHRLAKARNRLTPTVLSPDGQGLVVSVSGWRSVEKSWDLTTGKLRVTRHHYQWKPIRLIIAERRRAKAYSRAIERNRFNLTALHKWDRTIGRLEKKYIPYEAQRIIISPNGQLAAVQEWKSWRVSCWNTVTGEQMKPSQRVEGRANLYVDFADRFAIPYHGATRWQEYSDNVNRAFSICFSPDNKRLMTIGPGQVSKPQIWDVATGNEVLFFHDLQSQLVSATFGQDSKTIITTSADHTLRVWDATTAKLLRERPRVPDQALRLLYVSPQLDYWLAPGDSAEAFQLWHFDSTAGNYAVLLIDDHDHLTYDQHYRYDGTEAARKLLYFTCGTEVIALDQLKEQLWVPGLTKRLARGETISAPTIDQLNICGLTPQVEAVEAAEAPGPSASATGLPSFQPRRYRIQPRRGGLGETVLSVNGIQVRGYQPEQLQSRGGAYELQISPAELAPYLVPGQDNPVTVKAYTSDNKNSSRGLVPMMADGPKAAPPTNVYAVLVGVSDYKADALDLKYAAKDARDLGRTLEASARRLLNHDGKEHVFTYLLTTGPDHQRQPEKQAIKATLDEISAQATAGDLVLLFFAGHGVISGPDKRFYFLTADASPASAVADAEAVGISTLELYQWLHPSRLKAQKRILIFDACQSGKASQELMSLASSGLAGRADDEALRIKAIEKLNEESGLFILSAAASDQNAYETGRYAQGLLTYALLRAIKEQPAILDDARYLNVARWFGAAKNDVQELAQASGQRQQPQVHSTTNFAVGQVDDSVRRGIVLGEERPVFAASNFQSDAYADVLGLGRLCDEELRQLSSQSSEPALVFAGSTGMAGAYAVFGRYERHGDAVKVAAVVQQNGQVKIPLFELTGTVTALPQLAAALAREATERVRQLKP